MPRLFVALVAQLILPDVPAVAVKKATPTGGAQRKMISLRNEAARNNAQREKQNAVTARKNARQEKMRNLRKNLMEAYREKKGHPLASEEEQGAAAKEKQIKILSVRSKAKDDLLKLNHASSEEEQRILEAAVAVKPLEELYKFVPLPLDQRTATYGGIWQEAFNKYFQNLSLPNQDTVLNALSSISDGAQLVARWRAYLNHLKGKEREWAWLKSIDSDAVQSYLLPELHENFETLPLSLRYQQDYCSYAEAREEVNSAYIKLSSTRILNRSIVFIYPPDINKPLKRLVLEWLRTTYELSLREGKLQQIQEFLGGFTGDLLKLKEDRRYATDRFVKTETKNKISKLDDEKLRLEGLLTELRGTVATYKLYLDKVLKREKNDLKLQFKLATPFEELINRIKSEAKIESDSLNAALTKLINLAYPEIKRATFDTAAIEEELKTAKEKKEAAELEQQPIHEQKVADPDRREESESPAISTKNLRLSESGPAHSPQQLDSLSPPSESSNSNSGQTRCPPPAWAPPPDPRVSIQFNGKPYEAGDCVEFNPNSPLWNRDLTLAVKGTCEFNGVHGYWVLDGKGEACFVPVEDVSHCAERIDFS